MSGPNWNDLPVDTCMLILKFAEVEYKPLHPPVKRWDDSEGNRFHEREMDVLKTKIQKNLGYRLICRATKNWYRKELYAYMFKKVDRVFEKLLLKQEKNMAACSSNRKRRAIVLHPQPRIVDKLAKICFAYHKELNKDDAAHPSKWSNCRFLLVEAYGFLHVVNHHPVW